MQRFVASAGPGSVMDRGLWAWSRHPNYVGEIGFWFSMALFGVAVSPRDAWWLFAGVAIFGLATLVFAVSSLLWLSVLALAVLGAGDMISVYIRQSLVQIVTPDAMRGRVSAVAGLFIGASNELGEFETGIVAKFIGPVGAALAGGFCSLAATGLWAWMFPALRKADSLTRPIPEEEPPAPENPGNPAPV
jgi:hypothetical protein